MTTNTIPTDIRAEFDKKVRRGIFNRIARLLPKDVREDRLQEGIALTWATHQRHAERGVLLNDAILVHACALRAKDPSRYFVPTDSHRAGDVYDPRSYMQGLVEVLRFSDCLDHDNARRPDDHEEGSDIGLAVATASNPSHKILSAIDLNDWLTKLPAQDRKMLKLKASGHTLGEIAKRTGVGLFAVHRNCRRLGRLLAQNAGIAVASREANGVHQNQRPESTRRPRRDPRRAAATEAPSCAA